MPTPQDVLELLPRAELLRLADRFEVELPERRNKQAISRALASSQEVTPEKLLLALRRTRLQDLCRKLGLDTGGREKAGLVTRLLTKRAASDEVQTLFGAQGELRDSTVSSVEIYDLLARADEAVRTWGESRSRAVVSILLLLKRLNDVFDERATELIAEGAPESAAYGDPAEHEVFIPSEARWSNLASVPVERIGQTLNRVCLAVERANRTLEGIFTAVDFENEQLADAAAQLGLVRLVRRFSAISLRDSALAEPEALQQGYTAFLKFSVYREGILGGVSFTPSSIVRLLSELLAPQEGMSVCDPVCGVGSTLIGCARYVAEQGGYSGRLLISGQEKLVDNWIVARINMVVHGIFNAHLELGDTIREPKLVTDGKLNQYDRIIANPPFSLRWWGHEVAVADPHHRFRYGIPPRDHGDFAFLQHMVATLKPDGQLATIVPQGVLFRGKEEEAIRAAMLRDDLFEAVIGLPGRLLMGTSLPAAVLVLSKKKPEERKGKILFIDASQEVQQTGQGNLLRTEEIAKLVRAFRGFQDIPQYARVVDLDEIAANEFSLAIHRYIEAPPPKAREEAPEQMWRRIELKNYRSIAEARVELPPFSVVVGPNGSGKSNFADALVFARDVATDAATAVERRGGINRLRRWHPDGDSTVSVDVRAAISRDALETDYLRHQFTLRARGESAWAFQSETIELFYRGEPKLRIERTTGGVEIEPRKSAERIGHIARLSDTASAMVFARQLALLVPHAALRNVTRIRLNPDSMRLPQAATENTRLEESGSNIAVAFRSLDATAQERVLVAMQRIVPGLLRITVEPFDRFLLMQFDQKQAAGQVAKFSTSEMSEGALRALGILVAAQQMTQDELLIIEEPEVAIHVGAAQLLFEVLKDASTRGSVLLTTHSADLLDAAREEEILVCSYRDGMTRIGPLASAQREVVRQGLFTVAELLRSEPLRIEGEEPGTAQL